MEIKEKFKTTEFGAIPKDWEVKKLGDVGEIKMCRRVFNHETKSEGAIPFYKIGTFGKEADAYISQDLYNDYQQRFSFPKKGDILISAAGTIGRTIVYDGKPSYFQDSNIVWIDNNETLISNGFLYYVFQIAKYNTEGGTIQRLYNGILRNTKFICPSKLEQIAIATALSDIDVLIENLEKLITKKRNTKQGAMQKLFKSKVGWDLKRLGDIIEVLTDYTANGSFESLKVNVKYYETKNYSVLVRTTDLDKTYFEPQRFTDKKGYDFLSKTALYGGEIVIANVGSIGKVFKVPFYDMPMTLAPNTYLLRFYQEIDEDYIYQWMLTKEFYSKLMSKIGSTTLQAINKDNLRGIELHLPKKKNEQTQIAQILIDMDNEIEALEQKLQKYRMIKQGMMQVLLTGKIRLL